MSPSFKKRAFKQQGFTLVEMMAVLAIVGVLIGVFYLVWLSNWEMMENQMARADLWDEARDIIERISFDSRQSRRIVLAGVGTALVTVNLQDRLGASLAMYRFSNTGQVDYRRAPNQNFIPLSVNLDLANSQIVQPGNFSLYLKLSMVDRAFNQPIRIEAASEMVPRNQ